jgi:hypothetical protein
MSAVDFPERKAADAVASMQKAGQLIPVVVEPLAAFTVMGQLQLALRQPENQVRASDDPAGAAMVEVTRRFVRALAGAMGPEVAAAVELGFDPGNDNGPDGAPSREGAGRPPPT